MSKFEIKRGNKVLHHGDIRTLPDKERRKQMRKAGLKIYVDGRLYRD